MAVEGVKNFVHISTDFNDRFENHKIFNSKTQEKNINEYLEKIDTYHFCGFFQFIIFKHCSDYYPYLICGKKPAFAKTSLGHDAIGSHVLDRLNCRESLYQSCNLYSYEDSMGIKGWIDFEELESLLLENNEMDVNKMNEFDVKLEKILQYANSKNLSIISGMDLRYSLISTFSYKYTNQESYMDKKFSYLTFSD